LRDQSSLSDGERHRWRRLITLVAGGIVAEAGLFAISWFAPVMAGLIRPLYAAVAAVLAYLLWHAAQQRRGQDRRQADRRGPRDAGVP
jgi:CHASE2 domain-containing sensor protein